MTARSRAWIGFSLTAAVLLGVVTWLTVALLRLDRDEVHARAQAAKHERLRLALWRLDSWLAPQIAREALRPASEYRAFPAAPTAWTAGNARIARDAVKVQSPLVTADTPLFPLHFELGPDGITSPQVPLGNDRDLCEGSGVPAARLDSAAERLRTFASGLDRAALEQKFGGIESALVMVGCNPVNAADPLPQQQSVAEYSTRQRSLYNNAQAVDNRANFLARSTETVGPLVPFWLGTGDASQLVFARRVRDDAGNRVQGVLVDWPALHRELVAQLVDLFAASPLRFERCEQPTSAEQPSMLASVPVRLVADCTVEFESGLPLPAILGTTWGVTLLGLGVLWATLRAAIGYGERRARFASAVTHELRTPLTTFRMYSEMLADDVVTEPAARKEYLGTLQQEADRLARVVENVLAWSRLEEGRFTARRVPCETGPMVDRLVPTLQRRLAEAGLFLQVEVVGGAHSAKVTTDEDAVGQILFNLVDNAAKYARGAEDARVELRACVRGDRLELRVRDHGPGVPARVRERIFAPFDRGAVAAGSNEIPGVGLGLALARGLARDLGGDLRLDDDVDDGACFVLELALVPARGHR
ncbi:MAG: HAMP domain-containing histidine kinase [Planctomycetes bacterium]|nr:HAMP domain-containing histidine kinase [Planctomycetota bacterium]